MVKGEVVMPKLGNETANGECASHFQGHLKKYPPQVSSRNAASGWGCFIHNEVNTMLKKPIFDCNKIGDFYDCGCAKDEDTEDENEELKSRSHVDSKESDDIATSQRFEVSKEPWVFPLASPHISLSR
ncbi:unnamed protein product [Aspergillus oryzae]|uniref:Sulfhydryl oxidase n=2 Tax=Aspergillus oryzae TaxID=5062 RepID=A0AAN5BW66_ASPOZ|nr:unnamed protein product [Aspergillus oryzae]GMF90124.1 unnamed protein product [Aspergillus oryzae]GMG08374.1 unnamed protein product [Aspergillus oryzae]GMG27765.1 unnamed protein product [Aspergillus oryzae]GMG49764.1 unnamed protein product [Aspergillus oryzae var. brunneus]